MNDAANIIYEEIDYLKKSVDKLNLDITSSDVRKIEARLLLAVRLKHHFSEFDKTKYLKQAMISRIKNKGLSKLYRVLSEIKEKVTGNDEIKKNISDFIKKTSEKDDTNDSWDYIRSLLESEKPEWDDFYWRIFESIENFGKADSVIKEKLKEILKLYDLEYASEFDNFHRGTKMYDPALYQKFQSQNSSYAHNSIIEVLKYAIVPIEGGSPVRRPLVVVSFNT